MTVNDQSFSRRVRARVLQSHFQKPPSREPQLTIPPRNCGEGGPSEAREASEGWWEGPRPRRYGKKGRRNAGRRNPTIVRIFRCGARSAERARLSAFHRGSHQGAFAPFAQLQARLPGTRFWQALPALACPSPGKAPPGPVVVPVSMMPEAARVRSVSFRARAPHSLHLSEYLRDRRPRSSEIRYRVTYLGTGCQ